MNQTMWNEIEDLPGEILDQSWIDVVLEDVKEDEKFNVENHINSNVTF